jgi:hypothetical protein
MAGRLISIGLTAIRKRPVKICKNDANNATKL